MKTHLSSVILFSVFFSGSVFAIEPITDTNSVSKPVRNNERLPSGVVINLTFKSIIDDTFQPVLIKIPVGYTKTKTWPLLVVLHGLGDGPIVVPSIDSMVQVGPFGRGDVWYRGIGEKDVFECIELVKRIFNVDPERIYLCGFSMGGAGTFELGLKYPDIWAACVPVCGPIANLDLVENGRNLPFWINAGSDDRLVPARHSKIAYDKAVELGFEHWKYTEYEGMGHSFRIDWKQIEKWLLAQKKVNSPFSISFASEKPAKAYWAEITKKLNSTSPTRIDIETTSQTINVKISNIAGYKLYLKDAPVNLCRQLTIVENGKQIFRGDLSSDGIFSRKPDGRKTDKVCAE